MKMLSALVLEIVNHRHTGRKQAPANEVEGKSTSFDHSHLMLSSRKMLIYAGENFDALEANNFTILLYLATQRFY